MSVPPKTAPPIPNRLELPIGDEMLVRVDFDRAGDRWRHRISLVMSQQLALRLPGAAQKPGDTYRDPDETAVYSVMEWGQIGQMTKPASVLRRIGPPADRL